MPHKDLDDDPTNVGRGTRRSSLQSRIGLLGQEMNTIDEGELGTD